MKRVSADGLFLVAVMHDRKMPEMVEKYNKSGRNLNKAQYDSLKIVRTLYYRFHNGRLEANEDDRKKLQDAAQTLAFMGAEVVGGNPPNVPEVANFFGNDVPEVGTFQDVLRELRAGKLDFVV